MSNSETRMLTSPRQLSERERDLVRFLLSRPFPGRDDLVGQIPYARVSEEYVGEDPSIILEVDKSLAGPAGVRTRIPVEAWGVDTDGTRFEVLLHVVDGYLWEIEVFRIDSEPVRLPDPADLQLIVYYEGQT